ncbi:MAG: hypothetical protein NTX79_02500 [Candidatus Micrarchaeota archaeon]|nr:hypothetical protein [Candidatus Micrarchaeota archaeon]
MNGLDIKKAEFFMMGCSADADQESFVFSVRQEGKIKDILHVVTKLDDYKIISFGEDTGEKKYSTRYELESDLGQIRQEIRSKLTEGFVAVRKIWAHDRKSDYPVVYPLYP